MDYWVKEPIASQMVFNSSLSVKVKVTLSGYLVDGSIKKRLQMIYHIMTFLENNLGV